MSWAERSTGGLADHLNWARVNGKTPEAVTLEDLQRYMNGVTDQASGVYGIAWRRPQQTPLGASAAGNVATVVKAYYLTLSTSQPVNPDLVEALAADGGGARFGRSRRTVGSNPLAPRRSARRPRFLPDEVGEALFQPGVLTTARDVMIVTWLHDGGRVGRMDYHQGSADRAAADRGGVGRPVHQLGGAEDHPPH